MSHSNINKAQVKKICKILNCPYILTVDSKALKYPNLNNIINFKR